MNRFRGIFRLYITLQSVFHWKVEWCLIASCFRIFESKVPSRAQLDQLFRSLFDSTGKRITTGYKKYKRESEWACECQILPTQNGTALLFITAFWKRKKCFKKRNRTFLSCCTWAFSSSRLSGLIREGEGIESRGRGREKNDRGFEWWRSPIHNHSLKERRDQSNEEKRARERGGRIWSNMVEICTRFGAIIGNRTQKDWNYEEERGAKARRVEVGRKAKWK